MTRKTKEACISADVDGSTTGLVATMRADTMYISSVSKWTDITWIFDGRAVGDSIGRVTCHWDFQLHDGTTLLAAQYASLLHEARHFLWSLFSDRRNGRKLKESSVGNLFVALRRLLKWMVERNYASFGELDSQASDRFCDWLVEFYSIPSAVTDETSDSELLWNDSKTDVADRDIVISDEVGLDEFEEENFDTVTRTNETSADSSVDDFEHEEAGGVTSGQISRYLTTWRHLWEQRIALAKVGVPSIQECPFSGRSVYKVAGELATKVSKQIPPLPDEVAIPLMNAAHQFIEIASDDLIRAVEGLAHIRDITSSTGSHSSFSSPEAVRFLHDFNFSTPAGSDAPWHGPLGFTKESMVEELRRLVDILVDACSLIVQAESGMRLGELAALPAGQDELTGLPHCVTRRPSKSGMLDLYYVRSTLRKNRVVPTDEQWLLAAAPRGTVALPDAVNAVLVLQKVLAPFRAMASSDIGNYLIVAFGVPRSFPTTSTGVIEPRSYLIRTGQQRFAELFVDWSKIEPVEQVRPYVESSGRCIRTHQWRKTYAQYVFQVNNRLLPAIARQFKHLSLAMTEGAYVGTSASLVSGVAEFNRNLTTNFFLTNIRGTASKQEGRLAKLMDKYRPELVRIIKGLDTSDARKAVDAWCQNRDMKIFFHGYGKCIPAIAPKEAECHKRAQTVHWSNTGPNFAWRDPSTCTGCFLFLADRESIDYWNGRYMENMTSWLEAEAQGRGNDYRIAKVRAEQAKTYLMKLGAPITDVEKNHAR